MVILGQGKRSRDNSLSFSNGHHDESADSPKNQAAKDDSERSSTVTKFDAVLKFRNYKPLDSELARFTVDLSPALDIADELRDVLEEAKKFQEVEEIDLASLAPKKVDWDLKRDAQKKLDKLERRTQKAIIELIRQRLQAGSNELLLPAMNFSAKAAEESHMSDED
ncbi:cwf18 domain containing protein [Trichuris trichiura]|uniref:Cwf18 domain containing protein n=1 Tax=Trichuris trichiura TaxID=36087 RepID=A0A077Z8H4_TRITR|nr:cwf18 domain containing protein [Trichuris trichiura]